MFIIWYQIPNSSEIFDFWTVWDSNITSEIVLLKFKSDSTTYNARGIVTEDTGASNLFVR